MVYCFSLLQACATFCLMSEACLSFEYNASRPDCNWYTLADMTFIGDRPGYVYYMTNQEKVTDDVFNN